MTDNIQYLYVSYEDRQELIELGGLWDPKCKQWYIEIDKMTADLEPYIECEINVPYDLKDEYKRKYSIKWCPEFKSWFTSQQISDEIDDDIEHENERDL
jgi:hypothetical protein